ncbi:unnamed protein product [Rhizoctonia solani]|uniref:Zn(2)-C6 fungal-type domain-containing protein n=3 Tax=Rhizoctonia solani TaxID=456999 RepID=A0A8H3HNQ5_9AGAM|nr:fungal Zn(2)-cys(6) binuclear cluster domain protein, putative [Rhizoctonia solani AG-3 Rhs1AP]KEP48614.1 putative fungal Zn(2)-cys(6) binuclear cluster domain protein [Rhizoctonia solani 123E]CAE6528825.1 unnamed protein product [Rhizoctonia solani]
MLPKSRPGPLGASCLTCKRRHKRCDARKPVCKRCELGRFTCEGYGHNRRGPARDALPPAPADFSHSTSSGPEKGNISSWVSSRPGARSGDTATTSSRRSFTSLEIGPEKIGSPDRGSQYALVDRQTNRVEDYLRLFATRSTPEATGPMSILRKIIDLQTQLPSSHMDPPGIFLDRPWFVDYILEQSDKVMDYWYFKPVNYPQKRSRKDVVLRLQNSLVTRWIALIGMSILESFFAGDMSQEPLHNTWVGYIEGSLKRELTHDLTPRTTQERRSDWIHVSMLKTRIIHSSNTYQVLRSMTPTFLQVVFSEPQLWANGRDPTNIPLSNILGSEVHEVVYFALIDCTYSMATGLPQQVEYDTTIYASSRSSPQPNSSSSHQWAHSSPTEFQLVLADINACRDKSTTARDWRDIEQWLLAWQSRPAEHKFTESWMTVAWYAVQESWRLALLVYMYMAVCGISSDDSRIQSRIRQIIQVVGTIKKHGNSDANVSFFVQYLVVGICARSEAHRKLARDKLSAQTRLWLLRAFDFVPVLDHLWHGAAAGGRPIKWADYMRSREAMLPIVV